MADEFGRRGVGVIVASSDTPRAEEAKTIWGLQHLNVGYGLSTDHAPPVATLHLDEPRPRRRPGVEEPALFSEPGLFLVRPDGTLNWSSISTMPSARPHFTEILTSLDFAIKNNYPARGEAVRDAMSRGHSERGADAAADWGRVPREHSRRPRDLDLRRARQGRDDAPGLP